SQTRNASATATPEQKQEKGGREKRSPVHALVPQWRERRRLGRAARLENLAGVAMRVLAVDRQPGFDVVASALGMRAAPQPLLRGETLEQFRRRLASEAERLERDLVRAVVVQPDGEL